MSGTGSVGVRGHSAGAVASRSVGTGLSVWECFFPPVLP